MKLLLPAILYGLLIAQATGQRSFTTVQIDSVLAACEYPFNGVAMISQKGKLLYHKANGYADFEKQTKIQEGDAFVIGSVSKQFTAVLVLREVDAGRLNPDLPIRRYLPEIKQKWADSVTVKHLLSHTHGIISPDKPAGFSAGSRFQYSQLGYELLAQIVEKTSGKSFQKLSSDLFSVCKMGSSRHPTLPQAGLLRGFSWQKNGRLEPDTNSLENYPAAGSFISTATDLVLWNECLHGGKLLKKASYDSMVNPAKNAVRDHPVFGKTLYGYGTTVGKMGNYFAIGQTGFAPGFVTMSYYFPKSGTSVVLMENVVTNPENLKNAFAHHTLLLQFLMGLKY
jgi:CubicO group peptidase (beta-lactamase class C family)